VTKHKLAALTNEEAEAMAKRIRENPKAFGYVGVEPFVEESKPKLPEEFHVESHARRAIKDGKLAEAQVFAILAVADAIAELAIAVSEISS
jgi:hypothetical protein